MKNHLTLVKLLCFCALPALLSACTFKATVEKPAKAIQSIIPELRAAVDSLNASADELKDIQLQIGNPIDSTTAKLYTNTNIIGSWRSVNKRSRQVSHNKEPHFNRIHFINDSVVKLEFIDSTNTPTTSTARWVNGYTNEMKYMDLLPGFISIESGIQIIKSTDKGSEISIFLMNLSQKDGHLFLNGEHSTFIKN